MRILLPDRVTKALITTLQESGHRETGGILMGESVSEAIYRIRDITVQKRRGSVATFVRSPSEASMPLKRFFCQTNHEYSRFNYLGEWHSHPTSALEPSIPDSESMWAIVEDSDVGASFAVLLIVHLDDAGLLQGSVNVYLPGRRWFKAYLVQEKANT